MQLLSKSMAPIYVISNLILKFFIQDRNKNHKLSLCKRRQRGGWPLLIIDNTVLSIGFEVLWLNGQSAH